MSLRSPAVFVCEDNFLLADALMDAVIQLGCTIAACVGDFSSAMMAATESASDLAIIDLDLGGKTAYEVLDALEQRSIPYILATAAAEKHIPARFAQAPRITKPYSLDSLRQAMLRVGAMT